MVLKTLSTLFIFAAFLFSLIVLSEDSKESSANHPDMLSAAEEAHELEGEGEENIERSISSLPLVQYTVELFGKRNFQDLSTFSEKLLTSLGGESKLIKKLITQDKVVFELSAEQELSVVRESILNIRSSLPKLSLRGIEGETILLELK